MSDLKSFCVLLMFDVVKNNFCVIFSADPLSFSGNPSLSSSGPSPSTSGGLNVTMLGLELEDTQTQLQRYIVH